MQKIKVIVVLGPTASGKSDIAVRLAQKFRGEVISADSRQVYKGLDIGSGKITPDTKNFSNFATGQAEKKCAFTHKGIPHYLIDVVSPKERFTVSEYKKLAERAVQEISERGRLPIVCGGTAFYIDALLGDKLIPEVPPNPGLRGKLEKESVEELFHILKKMDPKRARGIDPKNPRRLIRAIEICEALGKVPSHSVKAPRDKIYDVLKIGIAPIKKTAHPFNPLPKGGEEQRDRLSLRSPLLLGGGRGVGFLDEAILKFRINKRLERRIKTGMISEAKKLHEKGLSFKRMRELGLEYGAEADLLNGKITKKEMIQRLQKEIRRFSKRQMTWFKRDKNIRWFDPSEIKKIEKTVKNFVGLP